MKKIPSHSIAARATIGALFFVAGIFLFVFGLFTARLQSAMPSSGTLIAGFQYSRSDRAVSASAGTALPPSAPRDRGPKIGFQKFGAPGTLVQVTDSSQGATVHTGAYTAHDAGEPSIGVN